MRVFYDANTILSVLLWPGFTQTVHERLVEAGASVLTSERVVAEVLEVARRKLPGVRAEDLVALDTTMRGGWTVIASTRGAPSTALRDRDDEGVLADAEASQATTLLTGDRDLTDASDRITTLAVRTPRQVYEEHLRT